MCGRSVIIVLIRENTRNMHHSNPSFQSSNRSLSAVYLVKDADLDDLLGAHELERSATIYATLAPRRIDPPSIPLRITKPLINEQPTNIDVAPVFPPPVVPMVDENEEDQPQDTRNRTTKPSTGPRERRGNSRNFTQNEASMLRTKVCQLLSRTGFYGDKRTVAADYDAFMEKHNVKCNQLCLLFVYEYLRNRHVEARIIEGLTKEINSFLTDRQISTYNEPEADREMTRAKINGNKEVLRVLFEDYSNKEIDLEWAESVYKPMFTKKQTTTINKPLSTLRKLQSERNPQLNPPEVQLITEIDSSEVQLLQEIDPPELELVSEMNPLSNEMFSSIQSSRIIYDPDNLFGVCDLFNNFSYDHHLDFDQSI